MFDHVDIRVSARAACEGAFRHPGACAAFVLHADGTTVEAVNR